MVDVQGSRWMPTKLSDLYLALGRALADLEQIKNNVDYTEKQLVLYRQKKDELLNLIEELREVAKKRNEELERLDMNPSGRK